jgi:hypothetical protein
MNKRLFAGIFTLLLTGAVSAQVSSPHITDLRFEIRNTLVRLTWTDSPLARGPVYIFRSARPFYNILPQNIRPVVLPYGSRAYIDDVQDLEIVYYFIAASDTLGQRFDTFLPRVNMVTVNVLSPSVQDAVETTEVHDGIYNIRTQQDGEKVFISYNTTDALKISVLYRSIQPIRQTLDLLNAVIVQSGISSPVVDYPIPGLSWYYAVIFEDDIIKGQVVIRPGTNATLQAVRLTGEEYPELIMRSIPLPPITAYYALPEGNTGVRPAAPISSSALRAIEGMGISGAAFNRKQPQVFLADSRLPAGGEESGLVHIVQNSFSAHDWETARAELIRYLSLSLSKEVEARARFYLAQTWYFSGQYRQALFEFFAVQPVYPSEAQEWIDATLSAMVQ